MKRLVFLLIFALIFFTACDLFEDDDNGGTGPDLEPTMETYEVSGQLNLNQNATVDNSELQVVTFASDADIQADGSFNVETSEADNYQVMFINHKTSNNPVYLGLYNPQIREISASDSTTALALTLFNPYLIYSDFSQRTDYLEAVQMNPKFTELLNHLDIAYQTDAATALDYETNPVIYQLAAQLMKETLESFGSEMSKPAENPPYIEPGEGSNVNFVNQRHVWYAAGIYPNDEELADVATMDRQVTMFSYQLGWPPIITTTPEYTPYDLGDGYFKIWMTKGGDFSKIGQWDDPEGRATLLNTGQAVLYVLELIIGNLPMPDMVALGEQLSIDAALGYQLAADIAQGNTEGFITHMFQLISENADDIAFWAWQEAHGDAARHFVMAASNIFSNVNLVFQFMGYGNEQGPFFWDLVYAPREVTYYITQEGGEIVSEEENNPPVAEFTIDPPAGIVGTEFNFNAADSYDDMDMTNELLFRWDWKTNNDWTNWSTLHSAMHTYNEAGSYQVTLQVKDSGGLIGSNTHTVNVGGGAGTATHVKLFRDNLPWDTNAMVTMLEELGFTEGVGENTYEIIPSTQMDVTPLIPGEDLVIISNDQNQTFYNNYAASQVRFSNFVYMGGSLFWEACDEGWAGGSIVGAGIVLPGNITTNFDYDYWNYVTDQNLPLVAGLPNDMDHNYASHESFGNVPDGTTVYTIDEAGNPTLIEFNLGGGWILMTGQPLEHQYTHIYGANDMEELLPRIVSYFTGVEFENKLTPQLQNSTRTTTR
jgi:PKD repeat protein